MTSKNKRAATRQTTDIRRDIVELLYETFPDGIVEMPWCEEGSHTIPDVFDCWFDLDGIPRDPEENEREFTGVDDEGMRVLHEFRDRISKTVASHGITVLPKDEGDKPVPWLQPGEEAWLGSCLAGGPVAVRDAFFFRMP